MQGAANRLLLNKPDLSGNIPIFLRELQRKAGLQSAKSNKLSLPKNHQLIRK